MRVPLVKATPLMGRSTMLNFLGALKPSLGIMATIFGYHSASAGASFCCAHSRSSGALAVSMVISQ